EPGHDPRSRPAARAARLRSPRLPGLRRAARHAPRSQGARREDGRRPARLLLEHHRRAVPAVVTARALYHTAFATGAATASGVRAALDARGDTDTTVMVWAGDGGTFAIGLQALSGAAERNENILYVCYDNEAYMNTGIQRSSATPWGGWTTTTPAREPEATRKKDILAIMAAHHIPYAATASI